VHARAADHHPLDLHQTGRLQDLWRVLDASHVQEHIRPRERPVEDLGAAGVTAHDLDPFGVEP